MQHKCERLNRLSLIFVMAAILSMGSHASASAQETLVVVNGDSITTADFDDVFSSVHGAMSSDNKMNFDYHKLVDRLVNDKLIVQEAEAIGIAEEPAFKEFMQEEREKKLIRQFVRDHYVFDKEVPEDQIADYFHKNYHKIQVRTIAARSRSQADSLKALIDSGAAMDSLARLYSLDVHRYQGGAHSLMYYAEIENDLKVHLSDPRVGQLLEPFPYREASLLMRVEQIEPPHEEELETLKGFIRNVLLDKLRRDDWQEFIDSLIAKLQPTKDLKSIAAISAGAGGVLDSMFMRGSDDIVATISGSTQLTEKELRLATAKVAMNAANSPKDSLVNAALNQWYRDKALLISGEKIGLGDDPRITASLEKTRDSALVEVYLKETVVPQIVFKRADFENYYDEHKEDFREEGQLYLRRMIISSAAKADSAYNQLQDGGEFNYVMDRFIAEDRRLVEKSEWVSLFAFPEDIREELSSLSVGDASRPFETPDGWIIFKVLERKEGRLKEPEEVDLKIREVMYQRQFNRLLDETLAILRENSEITYFDEAIDRYLGGGN